MPCFASWPRRRTPPIPRSSSRPRPNRSATRSGVSFAPGVTARSRATASGRSRTCFGELAVLPAEDLKADVYGDGGVVECSNARSRELLGKPAAAFMPSGTMAQQIALRIHADRRGRQVIAFHPTCHLEIHEDKAYQRLHGLVGLTVGDARGLHHARRPRGGRGAPGGARDRASAARDRRPAAGMGRPGRAGRARATAEPPSTWMAPGSGRRSRSTVVRSPRSPRSSTRSTSRSTRASARRPAACSWARRT